MCGRIGDLLEGLRVFLVSVAMAGFTADDGVVTVVEALSVVFAVDVVLLEFSPLTTTTLLNGLPLFAAIVCCMKLSLLLLLLVDSMWFGARDDSYRRMSKALVLLLSRCI